MKGGGGGASHSGQRRDSRPTTTHKDPAAPSTNHSHHRTPAPSTTAPTHHGSTAQRTAQLQRSSDRTSRVKAAFPVTVSYVSIQGGDDAHFELDTLGGDLIHKKALIRTPTLLDSPGRGGIRFDRSRTSFLNPKPATRPRLSRLDTDLGLGGGGGLGIGGGGGGGGGIHHQGQNGSAHIPGGGGGVSASVPSSLGHAGGQHPLGPAYSPDTGTGGSGPSLPKPAMPSPQYLEGPRGVSASAEHQPRVSGHHQHPHPHPHLTPHPHPTLHGRVRGGRHPRAAALPQAQEVGALLQIFSFFLTLSIVVSCSYFIT